MEPLGRSRRRNGPNGPFFAATSRLVICTRGDRRRAPGGAPGGRAGRGRRRAPAPRYGVAAMLLVGLTGGIGSGKSTVAAGLAARGAAVVDADAIARRDPRARTGRLPGRWSTASGPASSGPTAAIDRPALAAMSSATPTPWPTSTGSPIR